MELMRPEVRAARTSEGHTLEALSADRPVLLVCLRHLGCTFARQALTDLRAQRAEIDRAGATLVCVHLESDARAAATLARYGLETVPHISDPEARLYAALRLRRGGVRELLSPRVLTAWFVTAVLRVRGAGWSGADVRRMPGVFVVREGRILRAFRPATSADRPEYAAMCRDLPTR